MSRYDVPFISIYKKRFHLRYYFRLLVRQLDFFGIIFKRRRFRYAVCSLMSQRGLNVNTNLATQSENVRFAFVPYDNFISVQICTGLRSKSSCRVNSIMIIKGTGGTGEMDRRK